MTQWRGSALSSLRLLTAEDVRLLLRRREGRVLATVREAYLAHRAGGTRLPPSTFLRLSDATADRIIALPAYIESREHVAGLKWIASFPGNVERGFDRASAVIILNSTDDGRAELVMEGSAVSLCRTAASAAIAAQEVHGDRQERRLGVIGCGQVSFTTIRYLLEAFPHLQEFWLSDLFPRRAEQLSDRILKELSPSATTRICSAKDVLSSCRLIIVATTASEPHLCEPCWLTPGATVLHLSLRDFSPNLILECDNIVDDLEHACRERTSIHLAEMAVGHRRFIRCTLADLLAGAQPSRANPDVPVIFSPFGLGILDVAVAHLVSGLANEEGRGTVIPDFHPTPWVRK